MEFSKEQINFVDVSVYQKDGALQTDLYCKLTDTHHFLHFGSCHRFVYIKSIPYEQAIQMKIICSNQKKKLSLRLEDLEH